MDVIERVKVEGERSKEKTSPETLNLIPYTLDLRPSTLNLSYGIEQNMVGVYNNCSAGGIDKGDGNGSQDHIQFNGNGQVG